MTENKDIIQKFDGLNRFLNWCYCTSKVYLSNDLYGEWYDVYHDLDNKRIFELDSALKSSEVRIEKLFNVFAKKTEDDVVIDIMDTTVFNDTFSINEWKTIKSLVLMGKASFNTMPKKYRDEYPEVDVTWGEIWAKLSVKNINE